MSKKLQVVVGGQFGSEAKGHVTQRLVELASQNEAVPQVIRVAGPNAGHTAYDADGHAWPLRQVPVGSVSPEAAVLGIAAGSEIDPPVLYDELDRLKAAGLLDNKVVWVSGEATVITDDHKLAEGGQGGDLVKLIGSTGKGIGAARAGRLMRKADRVMDNLEVLAQLEKRGVALDMGNYNPAQHPSTTIIEGTQGFGLGLHAGFYPQCTSSDCRAIDFLCMAGISPQPFDLEVWVTARMFPIRVAGNSGPLANETTWEELGLPPEFTTVTKKLRRVGKPDWDLVRRAVIANGGPGKDVKLALTMVDQMFPFMKDKTVVEANLMVDPNNMVAFDDYLISVQRMVKAPLSMVCTGPNTASFINYP